MPNTAEALQFEMLSAKGSQPSQSAFLTVTHAKDWAGNKGWKAVMRIQDTKKRVFGAWRPTIVDAAKALVQNHAHRIDQTEARRIEKVVSSMQARRSGYICSRPCGSPHISVAGSEPSQSPAVSPAPSQVSRKGNAVHFVHQIYGLFGDGKPMSALFQESHRRWSDVAAGMGAQYHLWNADELESLVKQRYPQLWDMYCGVRYPIMRSDIGRIVVIHAYGGLYADLDIYPNRTWYEQSSFTLPRVQMTEKKHGFLANVKRKAAAKCVKPCIYLEMEVIIGAQENGIFLNWLEHIRQEIASKPYWDKKSFWYDAKMRYVYNTTGPKGLARFMRLPANSDLQQNMGHLECNHFSVAESMTAIERRRFDVISHESNSYFTNAHEIRVPVGLGEMVLPDGPAPKRMRIKSSARPMLVTMSDDETRAALPQSPMAQAPSQESIADNAGRGTEGDEMLSCQMVQYRSQQTDEMDRLAADSRLEVLRANQLKAFCLRYRTSAGAHVMMQEMPEELRRWIASDESQA